MDKLALHTETELMSAASATFAVLLPLLESKRAEISSVPRRTFKYADASRCKLDIYYPPSPRSDERGMPILFFCYGGGFNSGARILPPPADLCYVNVGAYFAQRGFITVIPDYRLVPEVKFPEPARDVRDAMAWVISHPENLCYEQNAGTNADLDSLFIMGVSAGASHVFTALALPELFSDFVHSRIKGAILFSGAYHYDANLTPAHLNMDQVVIQYWGSLEQAQKDDTLGLLERLSDSGRLGVLPKRILLIDAEKDPVFVKAVGDMLFKKLLSAQDTYPTLDVQQMHAQGHNHISPTFVLGTGQGEEWAEQMIDWMSRS